ncbi:hypothetical protein [Streptomyces sp. NPDC046821]|uniref:hypothetical protein n=1 Tax=Streptomyces sp. NPDC046821 TaxID=3154702 RepID=UPI0033FBCE3A
MALASLAALLVAAGYAVLCAVQPFAPCRKCSGTGIRQVRRKVKLCRRCRGQRHRLRTGRRLLNTGRQVRRDGTRRHHHASDRESTPWQ